MPSELAAVSVSPSCLTVTSLMHSYAMPVRLRLSYICCARFRHCQCKCNAQQCSGLPGATLSLISDCLAGYVRLFAKATPSRGCLLLSGSMDAVSMDVLRGVSMEDICVTASWSFPSAFVKTELKMFFENEILYIGGKITNGLTQIMFVD